MESQPQNPEFRNNPENFHPCKLEIVFVKQSPHNHIVLVHKDGISTFI